MANPYKVGIELAMSSNHAAVLGALSSALIGVHPHVTKLTEHFGKLQTAIAGALGIGTGMAIFGAIDKLIDKTKGLSHEVVQLQKLGLAEPEIARIRAQAVEVVKAVPGTTE